MLGSKAAGDISMLSLAEWALLAEIIAAAGVITSLIYLAVQMRLTRVASEAQLSYSSLEVYSRWRTVLLENSDLPRAIEKSNQGEALSGDEKIQLNALMEELFLASVIAYVSMTKTPALHDHSLDIEYIVGILEDNPGLIPQWERFRGFVEQISPEYGQSVDRRLNQIGNNRRDDDVA